MSETWDVIVVGGGPAGMMAAGTAAARGARTLVLEKNATLGKKLLITGGGRCNVTNAEPDARKLLEKFKDAGKFLFSAFAQWGVRETLGFFQERGMETKVENELRVFPVSDSARSVWEVLVARLREHGVAVRSDAPVAGLLRQDGALTGVRLASGEEVRGAAVIVATGGTSRPETGSTGDGYAWLREVGHAVAEPAPSLVPIVVKDAWARRLAGTALSGVKVTLLQDGAKQGAAKGRVLFTHVGVSGPTVLNMSRDVGELLKYGEVVLSLDLFPAEDEGRLGERLRGIFEGNRRKKLRNALAGLAPAGIVPSAIELAGIDPEVSCSHVAREERLRLARALKGIPLHVDRLLGPEKAVITSGGVALEEVDFRTMRSRIVPNLYLIGDILDVDRPSGGYSLQLCWTTGFVAGTAASESVANAA